MVKQAFLSIIASLKPNRTLTVNTVIRLSQFIQKTFALWLLLVSAIAFVYPQAFAWLTQYITWFLGIIMFGMGMTMTLADFQTLIEHPKGVVIGVLAQFIIMPTIAYVLTVVFRLPLDMAIGVLLVGCCPGGTASNVITFLAKGNVGLSIACTTVSTLLAPLLTPLMFYLFAKQWIDIDASAMMMSVLQVVLLPIVLGLTARTLFKQQVSRSIQIMPLVSVTAIIIIVAAIVANSKAAIISSGLFLLLLVILHNGFGLLLGYFGAKFFGLPIPDRRAIAIEVGMQNSGLGVALAAVHFATMPVAAVPSAIFSVWHNISGSLLATWWQKRS